MITCYFGVPGCGKTTLLTKIAQKELKRIDKGKSKYSHVLTNFYCEGCEVVDFKDLADFRIEDSLILLDEITLDADGRAYKSFSNEHKRFFTLHRHLGNDIVVFCQDYSRMDKTIRNNVYDLWYVTKPIFPLFRQFSVCRRIFRNIAINEFTSELSLGYRFSTFWERIFSPCVKFLYRKPYYKYFDSYDCTDFDGVQYFNYESWDSTP
ncbi:MAG: zonular occludens toxin domain-containing protein [Faecalibacterium sp.]|nr:zonular occludens toxin domain-containing protein [Ruminococcus sp.]MCM1484694.1 zonular occludens toxin domain-containing protein [Faecalibacterium sp.]